jgi:hypothetical protein
MASRDEVRETVLALRSKFSHEKIAPAFKGWSRIMQYHFPDIDLSLAIPVKDGVPEQIVEGRVDGAQIVYEMDSDTLLALARKEISGMKAYSQKLVKVKASMTDLLKLQRLDSV